MARRRYFDEATLTRLRDMPASDALVLLALYVKEDPTYVPVKTDRSQRWHVRTAYGEYEILTTGCQWYDMGRRRGGGGAIDLAMHIRGLSFVDAVKQLTSGRSQHGSDNS